MSLWQTHDWQHMLQKSWQVEAYFEVDAVYVEKRKISLWKFGLFVTGVSENISEETLEKIQALCKKEKCIFVQFETCSYEAEDISIWKLKEWYYKKFIPPYTCVIDITKSDEEILAAMKQKGRYNIRLAEKKWVIVEQVEKNSYNAEILYKLISQTTQRNNFSGNTHQYYEIFLKSLKNSQLFFAYYEDEVIAAGVFVGSGDVMYYYYGASSDQYRNLMAPYLLQWKAIEHAKKRDFKIYDFLGVAGPDDSDSTLAGVTDFKMKLSPDRRKVSQGYIYVHKKILYFFIKKLKDLLGR